MSTSARSRSGPTLKVTIVYFYDLFFALVGQTMQSRDKDGLGLGRDSWAFHLALRGA